MDLTKLDRFIVNLETNYGVPAFGIQITKGHQTIYQKYAGHSDSDGKKELTEDNLFQVFSATKMITMIAVMQLLEQGKLSLYEDISRYLPEFAFLQVADGFDMINSSRFPASNVPCHIAQHPIRIIDLMTMTGGLNYDIHSDVLAELKKNSKNLATTYEMVSSMSRMPLIYEPGTRWCYSYGHDILAGVVEVVSGLSFGEYLKKNVFEPLGVKNFWFQYNDAIRSRICQLYINDPSKNVFAPIDGENANVFRLTSRYESGGAGLITTVKDYSAVIEALANGGVGRNGNRILCDESIRRFTLPYTKGTQQEDFVRSGRIGYSYGLGVRVHTDPSVGKSPLGEFGWDGAAGAYLMVDPINEISIFYAEHIVQHARAYTEIHPMIRDLVYEGLK